MQWQAVPGIRTGKPETLLARPRSGVFRYNATSSLVDLHPAILPFDRITDSCVYLICLCLHYSCMSSGLKSCAYWRRATSTGRRLASYSTSTSTTAPNTWKRFVLSLPPRCLPVCITVQLVMFQRIHFETLWSHRADDAAHLLSSHFHLTICGLLLDSH